MKPSAVLFDLDDTILECEGGDYLKLWMECIEEYIHRFPSLRQEDLFNEIKIVADEFWSDQERHRLGRLNIRKARQKIVSDAARRLKNPDDEAAIELANQYHERRENNNTPFPGAIETLEYFRETPIKTALITNGSAEVQRRKIEKYRLDQYFDMVLIEGEFGLGKPNPGVYSHIIDQLNVKAEASWIVGDNLVWEVEVPQKLGFFSIWNDYRRKGLPRDTHIVPDRIVNAIYELIEISKQS